MCVSVCVCVTVQLDDLLQVDEDALDVLWRQDGVSVQPLVENTVQHLQRPQVSALSVEQLWGRDIITYIMRHPVCMSLSMMSLSRDLTVDDFLPFDLLRC